MPKDPSLAIEPVSGGNWGDAVGFLRAWVCASDEAAQAHLADHPAGGGSSLLARWDGRAVGIVTLRWRSLYAGFSERNIPLVHQLAVAPECRRRGIATALMDSAEALARARGHPALGITVGLFAEYGPAQRLYVKRGYVPDGRGVCVGSTPVGKDSMVVVDHALILWLTKDL